MRVPLCTTIIISLIIHASKRVAASPLPHYEWDGSSNMSDQDDQMDDQFDDPQPGTDNVASGRYPDYGALPAAKEGATTVGLQAAFDDPFLKDGSSTTRQSSSHHSTRRTSQTLNNAQATSIQRTTIFATAVMVSNTPMVNTPLMNLTEPLSPLLPLNAGGRSAMKPLHHRTDLDAKVLPWVLGFLLPAFVGAIIWIIVLLRRRKESTVEEPSMIQTSDSGIGGLLGTSSSLDMLMAAQLSSDPIHPPGLNSHPHAMSQFNDKDPYELKSAHFPTRHELGEYVFPPTAASVQRDILVSKQGATSIPPPHLITIPTSKSRIITSTRPLNLTSKRAPPPRPPPGPKKRHSPLVDVLYATNVAGDALETVDEEEEDEDDEIFYKPAEGQDDDEAMYKTVQIDLVPGPMSEDVPLASSTSYYDVSLSPKGLRARRRSSPLLPSIDLYSTNFTVPTSNATTNVHPKVTQSPIIGRLRSSSVGRQCSDAATKIGQFITNAAERVAPSPKTSAAEEEKKFAEFVKGLVRGMNARDKKRGIERGESKMESGVGRMKTGGLSSMEQPSVIYSTGGEEVYGKHDREEEMRGLSILLPPPSFGAKLSDFISEESLGSELPPSSSSRLSIGIAL